MTHLKKNRTTKYPTYSVICQTPFNYIVPCFHFHPMQDSGKLGRGLTIP